MKKILVAILVVIMATTLIACGKKPSNMTEETYKNGCRALEIMDKYNSAEISKEEAEDRLTSIRNSLDREQFSDDNLIEDTANFLISNTIFLFTTSFNGGVASSYDEADRLRDMLGKK